MKKIIYFILLMVPVQVAASPLPPPPPAALLPNQTVTLSADQVSGQIPLTVNYTITFINFYGCENEIEVAYGDAAPGLALEQRQCSGNEQRLASQTYSSTHTYTGKGQFQLRSAINGIPSNILTIQAGTQSTYTPSPSPSPTPTPSPLPAPPPNPPTLADGSLIKDGKTIYVIENGTKRGFTNMEALRGLGYKLSNAVPADTSNIPAGPVINSKNQRHPRGSVVNDRGTIYFLGTELRYPFPSAQVFLSWGNKFANIVSANSYDLKLPLGPIVQKKQ